MALRVNRELLRLRNMCEPHSMDEPTHRPSILAMILCHHSMYSISRIIQSPLVSPLHLSQLHCIFKYLVSASPVHQKWYSELHGPASHAILCHGMLQLYAMACAVIAHTYKYNRGLLRHRLNLHSSYISCPHPWSQNRRSHINRHQQCSRASTPWSLGLPFTKTCYTQEVGGGMRKTPRRQ